MKSETCFGKASGQPLSCYDSEYDAQQAAEYANEHYENNLSPYKCHKCEFWHLSPKSRMTPSTTCHWCTGGDGNFKASYRTEREANARADIIYQEQGIVLKVYQCEYGAGWHLTKRL